MADTKITALAALTGANVATGDELAIVDVSDTSMAASGTDKNITADEFAKALATTLGVVGRDKVWDAKGDLAVATGADAASALTVGSDGSILVGDASQTTGMRWGGQPWFGDGSDGPVTITSGTTTLTRDQFYTTLIVNNGATLNTQHCRVFCSVKCQVDTGGLIHNNGPSASGTSGGAAVAGVTLTRGQSGVNGGTGAGTIGTAQTNTYGGAGGAGGAGGSGAGGGAGTVSVPVAAAGSIRHPLSMLTGLVFGISAGVAAIVSTTGAASGGSGGGDGTAGGGSGAGGGIVLIAARTIVNNGTIQALGGNGGTPAAGNRGGGGGGGGGVIMLVYNVYSGSTVMSAATHCAGGTHGNKTGTGVNGSDGGAGSLFTVAA